jgi:hypothetical protein
VSVPPEPGSPLHTPLAHLGDLLLPIHANGIEAWDDPVDPYAHLHLIDWPTLWAGDEAEIEDRWLLEPLIPARRQMALYAGAKVGKSDLMLWLCCHIALGLTLDGRRVPPRHVLYMDYEMTPEDLRDRLEYFGFGPEHDLSHLHYASLPSIDALDTASGGDRITADATSLGVELVVIDTAGRAVTGDENDADTYRSLYARTGRQLKAQGIALVRLDHAGKDETKGQRGSSGKNDDVDVVLSLTRVEGGALARATHRRMEWYPQQTSLVREENYLEGWVRWGLAKDPLLVPAGTKDLADVMAEMDCPVLSLRKTETWLKEHGVRRRRQVVAAAIRYRSEGVTEL